MSKHNAEAMIARQTYRNNRRRGKADHMNGTANLLDTVIEGNFKGILEEHEDYYDEVEYRAIKKAQRHLKMCVKILRALEKRLAKS